MNPNSMLFTIKTVLRKLLDLFPLNSVPAINPTSKEGVLFNKTMHEIIENVELNMPIKDRANFMVFLEATRKIMLYLMEKDGYYRKYVTMFFDKVKSEW